MTERDGVPRSSDPNPQSTNPDRARAQAVHSVDDETRLHAGGDETDIVQGAGGEIFRPDQEDRGGAADDNDENV